jgi:hypothetical protein
VWLNNLFSLKRRNQGIKAGNHPHLHQQGKKKKKRERDGGDGNYSHFITPKSPISIIIRESSGQNYICF